ncbi:MAG: SprT-like domain-containing protein, partial [Thermoleophilia bacterium]|nr:SprT-like domain-containing protein [Thermoleophilia bacterium]
SPAILGVPQTLGVMAWKYARILGVDVIPQIKIRDNQTSRWLGRYKYAVGRHDRTNLMEIQRRVMFDARSLERIVAHEMVHHADFLTSKGEVRRLDHGPRWQFFADKVNRVMGEDFVTVVSDSTIIQSPVTKQPYIVMITRIGGGVLGVQNARHMTLAVRDLLKRSWHPSTRFVWTTDSRWATPKTIGGRKVTIPREHLQDLEKLYLSAVSSSNFLAESTRPSQERPPVAARPSQERPPMAARPSQERPPVAARPLLAPAKSTPTKSRKPPVTRRTKPMPAAIRQPRRIERPELDILGGLGDAVADAVRRAMKGLR